MSKLMASEEEVQAKQMLLMLDKAVKHFRLANHWLDKARDSMKERTTRNV